MARTKKPVHAAKPQNGAPSADSVVEIVRALWTKTETASEPEKLKLKRDIVQTVSRLKNRIELRFGTLKLIPRREPLLFDETDEQRPLPKVPANAAVSPPRFKGPTLRIYDNDLATHTLQHLPQAIGFHSVDEFRNYLSKKIRFNAEATRSRSANYLISRFFPGDVYHPDLPTFAAVTADEPALGEALFYLACRTEKILSLVAEVVVFPSLPQGGVTRIRIREFIHSTLSNSESSNAVGQSIVRTYQTLGVATGKRLMLNASLREDHLASFAYILHLEFPEPMRKAG